MIPEIPNYENFLKATNKAFPIIALFMQILLLQNRQENESGVHFIDFSSGSMDSNFMESVLRKELWNLWFSQAVISMTAK